MRARHRRPTGLPRTHLSCLGGRHRGADDRPAGSDHDYRRCRHDHGLVPLSYRCCRWTRRYRRPTNRAARAATTPLCAVIASVGDPQQRPPLVLPAVEIHVLGVECADLEATPFESREFLDRAALQRHAAQGVVLRAGRRAPGRSRGSLDVSRGAELVVADAARVVLPGREARIRADRGVIRLCSRCRRTRRNGRRRIPSSAISTPSNRIPS